MSNSSSAILDRLERLSLYTAVIDRLYQHHGVQETLPYLAEDIIHYLWPYRTALRSIIERPAFCGGGRLQYAFISRGEAFGAIVLQSYGNAFQFTSANGAGFGRSFPCPKKLPYQVFDYDDNKKMVYAFDPISTVINCEGIDLPYFSKEYKDVKGGSLPVGLTCPKIRWFEDGIYIAGIADDQISVWRAELNDDNCQYSATVVWKSSSRLLQNLTDFFVSRSPITGALGLAFCSGDGLFKVTLGSTNSVMVTKLPFKATEPMALLTPSMVCRTINAGDDETTVEVVEVSNGNGSVVFTKHLNWVVDRLFTTLEGSLVVVSKKMDKLVYIKGMQYETAWEGSDEDDDDVDVIEPLGSDTGEWDSADETD